MCTRLTDFVPKASQLYKRMVPQGESRASISTSDKKKYSKDTLKIMYMYAYVYVCLCIYVCVYVYVKIYDIYEKKLFCIRMLNYANRSGCCLNLIGIITFFTVNFISLLIFIAINF